MVLLHIHILPHFPDSLSIISFLQEHSMLLYPCFVILFASVEMPVPVCLLITDSIIHQIFCQWNGLSKNLSVTCSPDVTVHSVHSNRCAEIARTAISRTQSRVCHAKNTWKHLAAVSSEQSPLDIQTSQQVCSHKKLWHIAICQSFPVSWPGPRYFPLQPFYQEGCKNQQDTRCKQPCWT